MSAGNNDLSDLTALQERVADLEQRLLEVTTLYQVAKALSLSLLTENLIEITGAIFADVFNAVGFILYLDDPHRQKLFPIALHQRGDAGHLPGAIGYDHPVLGPAFRDGESCTVDAAALQAVWPEAPAALKGRVLVTPLKPPRGRTLGVLAVALAPEATALMRLDLLTHVAENLAVAIENARYVEEARVQSTHDPLTDLPNRRYLDDRLARELARAQRYGRVLSVAVLDLDRFKQINDRYGHDAGDRALIQVARLLRQATRQSDVLARYGGDEFVVLLPETDKGDAVFAVENILERLHGDAVVANGLPTAAFSAGVASYPTDAQDAPALLRKADRALYRAKGQGGDRVLPADAQEP